MSRFLIGQVCNALGVRAHVLRYWERHVELLSPAKDRAGRRIYTLRDVHLLFRLKYLIQTRGMSVEGASRKLVEEVQGGGQNRKAALDSLRGDLFRVHLGAQRLGEQLRSLEAAAAPGRAGTPAAPPDPADELIALLQRSLRDGPRYAPGGTPAHRVRGDGGPDGPETDAARRLLSASTLLVVTPTPEEAADTGAYPGLLPLLGRGGETVLDRIGSALSGLAAESGHPPHWLIGAPAPAVALVEAHLRRRGHYGLPPGEVEVYGEPEIPFLDEEGAVAGPTTSPGPTARPGRPAPAGRPAVAVPTYRLPLFVALASARACGRPARLCLVLPATNALPRVPDLEFIARHLAAEATVSAKVTAPAGAGAREDRIPTGELLVDAEAIDGLLRTVHPARDVAPVRRFGSGDDILEMGAVGARFDAALLLGAAGGGLTFEVDREAELALLRSPADWDTCSARVRAADRDWSEATR